MQLDKMNAQAGHENSILFVRKICVMPSKYVSLSKKLWQNKETAELARA